MAGDEESKQPIIIINKKGGHGGHHGGAWKVAYADFVTALMAFFLVMWLVGQSDVVKENVMGYFNNPAGWGKNKGGFSVLKGGVTIMNKKGPPPMVDPRGISETRASQVLKLAGQRIRDALSGIPDFEKIKSHIEIEMTEEGLRIELSESTTPKGDSSFIFALGSAELSAKGKLILAAIAKELAKLDNKIVIEGHTDARRFAYKNKYSNWELSADRANSARKFMLSQGIKEKQIEGIRGYAANHLKYPNHPLDARNRRISILVLRQKMESSFKRVESHEIINGKVVKDSDNTKTD